MRRSLVGLLLLLTLPAPAQAARVDLESDLPAASPFTDVLLDAAHDYRSEAATNRYDGFKVWFHTDNGRFFGAQSPRPPIRGLPRGGRWYEYSLASPVRPHQGDVYGARAFPGHAGRAHLSAFIIARVYRSGRLVELARDDLTLPVRRGAMRYDLKASGPARVPNGVAPPEAADLGPDYVSSSLGGKGVAVISRLSRILPVLHGFPGAVDASLLIIHKHLGFEDRVALRGLDQAEIGKRRVRAELARREYDDYFEELNFPVRVTASDMSGCRKGALGRVALRNEGEWRRVTIAVCGKTLMWDTVFPDTSIRSPMFSYDAG